MTQAQPTHAPAWLSDLQWRFSAVLRTPIRIGPENGWTEPTRNALYDRELVREILGAPSLPAVEQLAVYNRQYWFRLCGVLQHELALTARLLGFSVFNGYAVRFLLARPPHGHDIHEIAHGFAEFLDSVTLDGNGYRARIPRAALLEAAAVDGAFQRLLYAPSEPRYEIAPNQVAALARARLQPSNRWTMVEEHWPLVGLKRALAGSSSEDEVGLPPRLPAARSWLLCNTAAGATMVAMLPEQAATLFRLLTRHRVGDALERLERQCPPSLLAQLPDLVQRWVAQSMELGFWTGLEGSPTT